jgi:hypothetical protein
MSDTEHGLRVALLNAADRVRILHEGLLETARQRDDARNEIERLRARVGVLEKTLKHAASVSHNGGLVGFSEHDALIAVRRLTLAYWGREHGEAARATVIAALEAQP